MALEDEIINIEDLEIATEVKIGDYVLLETTNGTRLLDFKDFIIGVDNITFFDKISGTYLKTSDISAISAKAENNHNILTTLSTVAAENENNKTRINSLQNSFAALVDNIDAPNINAADISPNTNSKVGFTVSNATRNQLANGAIYFENIDFQGTGLTHGSGDSNDIYKGASGAGNGFFYKAKGDYGMIFMGSIGVYAVNNNISQAFLTINKNGILHNTMPVTQGYSPTTTSAYSKMNFSFSVYINLKQGDKITLHVSDRDQIEASTFSGIKVL